jgi:hypothetical protein
MTAADRVILLIEWRRRLAIALRVRPCDLVFSDAWRPYLLATAPAGALARRYREEERFRRVPLKVVA